MSNPGSAVFAEPGIFFLFVFDHKIVNLNNFVWVIYHTVF